MNPAIAERLGFGCGRLRGGVEERNSRRLIDAALECGIRYFDTAPSYGDGASERLLGLGLRHVRAEVAICTKIGFPRPAARAKAAAVRALLRTAVKPLHRRLLRFRRAAGPSAAPAAADAVERSHGRFDAEHLSNDLQESLDALQTDHLECLLLHEPRLSDPTPAVAEQLLGLVNRGVIARTGVGTGSTIEALPPFGAVAQAAISGSLLQYPGPRSVVAHGLFRGLSEQTFERCAVEAGLLRALPALRSHLGRSHGISGLLLACTLLGSRLDRILWSTSSVSRLREVLAASAAAHDELLAAWSPQLEAMLADTLRRYVGGVHAAT